MSAYMKIVWTPQAEQDRLEIFTYIAMDNPKAAITLDERFGEVVARLETFPDSGQPGKISGTRELFPHENYRIIYDVEGDTVFVLAVVHASRMWPPL